MKRTVRFSGFVSLLLLVFAAATAQSQFTLTYKFPKGKTVYYRSTAKSNMTQEMGGQEMKVTNDVVMKTRLVVDNVAPNGDATLVVSADSVRTHMKTPMKDTTMEMKDVIGKRVRLTVSSLGKVVKREVLDSMKSQMGTVAAREMIRFNQMPGKPVNTGDKWTSNVVDSVEMAGGHVRTTNNVEYTLVGREQKAGCNCVKITYTGKLTLGGKGSMMGMDLFIEGSGTMTGTLYFDDKAGMMVLDDATVDNELTMAATGQQNMTIPITQSTHYVHSLVH